jgi:hypothetical protein
MITGDLVECNDTGSLGVVTKVHKPYGANASRSYYDVLFTDGTHEIYLMRADISPLPDEAYAP